MAICLVLLAVPILSAQAQYYSNNNTSSDTANVTSALTYNTTTMPLPQLKVIYSLWNLDPNYPGLNIIGEVVNESPRMVSSVKLITTAYDAEGRVIGVAGNDAAITTLYPGFKSPFGVTIHGNLVPLNQISSYIVTVDWK